METYPVDADYPPPEQAEESSLLAPSPTFNDLTEQLVVNKEALASKKKTTKKRKTVTKQSSFRFINSCFFSL